MRNFPISAVYEALRQKLSVGRRKLSWLTPYLKYPRVDAPGPDFSKRSAFIYLAAFAVVFASVVLANWKWNALVGDTLLLFSSFEMLESFSSLFSNLNSNPLQAMFDIFPSALRLDTVPNLIARTLFGPGAHVEFVYSVYGALLAFAVTVMARAAGLRWGVAVLAGILLPLLVFPTFGMFPFVEHFYILWPVTYYAAAGTTLVTALYWWIDGRSWKRDALLTGAIVIVLMHLAIVQVLFMTLLAPAMIAMGIGALAVSESRAELRAKIVCAVVIVAALAAAGILNYMYALGINTATYVFYQRLIDFMLFSGPSWGVVLADIGNVIHNPFTYHFKGSANLNGILVPLAQLGAIYLAVLGPTRRIRIFGRTMICWVIATAAAIAILHNFFYYTGLIYRGPDPRHFVPILWPYYAICLAALIFAFAARCVRLLIRFWPAAKRAHALVPHVLAITLLAVPFSIVASNWILSAVAPNQMLGSAIFQTYLPYFHGHKRTPIIDYLEPQVGVAIDKPFRGSVVAMPTVYNKDAKPYAVWRRETTFAYARAYLGNDMGAFGLRHFNIPTLDQMTHNITPQLFLTAQELLTRPDIDTYDRHFVPVTRYNEPILTLLGVRYLITDFEAPIGTERFSMPIPEDARKVLESAQLYKSPLRIYELAEPNVGNYSPTRVIQADTAKATIVEMARPDFDGRKTFVTDDTSIGGNLVPATGAGMTVRLGGVALQASSTGQSVLVLPVQYSHCWQIVSGGNAKLFRANMTQLGVLFSGELRVELRQFFGPFWQSSCRLADAADIKRLRTDEAVGAGEELKRVPGDGINRVPTPEALDKVMGSSAIASVEPTGPANASPREYKVTAQGGRSEHYSVLKVPNIVPGAPYTFSMQVRADSSPRMSLQLQDGANGVFAEFLLPTRNVWVHRLGNGEQINATIRKVDDEWFHLTVTSILKAEGANLFVHVSDKGNSGSFKPRGESVTIRAVKLERGETATPYQVPDK